MDFSFLCSGAVKGLDHDISWQQEAQEFCFILFVCFFPKKEVDSVVEDHSHVSRCGGQNKGEAPNLGKQVGDLWL